MVCLALMALHKSGNLEAWDRRKATDTTAPCDCMFYDEGVVGVEFLHSLLIFGQLTMLFCLLWKPV
jgi:hypothetical protein